MKSLKSMFFSVYYAFWIERLTQGSLGIMTLLKTRNQSTTPRRCAFTVYSHKRR